MFSQGEDNREGVGYSGAGFPGVIIIITASI